MKKILKKTMVLLLVLTLTVSLIACGKKEVEPESGPGTENVPISVMVLNGTTGFGMAGLMHNAASGQAAQDYNFQVETDASNVMAELISGSVDIAALPTNAASVVYNKTGGAVQALALNTQGVLYLVSDGNVKLADFVSLAGETVYVPAQNPSFIFSYLCQANGLTVGQDIFIDNTFAQPAELRTAVAAGQVKLAVLPEPMVSMALAENETLRVEMDLTEQWDMVAPEGSLVQGCVVVRKEFAQAHPAQVETFLEEYGESIDLCMEDAATAASFIAEAGILGNASAAEAAIPRCNLCFVTGEDMRTRLSQYLRLMEEVNPQSIGGAVPAEEFYFVK